MSRHDAPLADGAALLSLRGLTAGYRRRRTPVPVVVDARAALRPGQLACLVGVNGSGKSTLLRTVAGMQPALSGTAVLGGEDLGRLPARERARRMAVVLTDGGDPGMLRAVDVVAIGRHPRTGWTGRLRAADRRAIAWALQVAGAAELAFRRMVELSDGQRQRVWVARALAQQPELLVLDEPTAYLDLARRLELAALLRHLADEHRLGVLVASHDLDLVDRADQAWLLTAEPDRTHRLVAGEPGRLAADGALAAALEVTDRELAAHHRGRAGLAG